MFVSDNSVKSIRQYFTDRLQSLFSASEIRFMFQEALMVRLNLTKSELILSDTLRLSESDLLYFRSIVKRLLNNEPYQYIVGSTIFYDLRIKCDARALIPRPETEELVDWIVKDAGEKKHMRILDVCTGTGCIALALKSVFTESNIQATDISEDALNLAQLNATENDLQIELFQMDVLKEQLPETMNYDIWVSNPPYIPEEDKEQMHPNVLAYEPHLALFVSNDDPLVFYRRIGEMGLMYLKNGGKLYFEIHEKQGHAVCDLLQTLGYRSVELRKDLQGRERMVGANKP